jgi:hypothetical protein
MLETWQGRGRHDGGNLKKIRREEESLLWGWKLLE